MDRLAATPTLPLLQFARPAWQDRALCAQADPDEWYPEAGESALNAKRICRRCPVRVACLRAALDYGDQHGIWGGLSRQERERAAPLYARGADLGDIIDDADADMDARRAAAAEHQREAGRAGGIAYKAVLAERVAAMREQASSVPHPGEQAA